MKYRELKENTKKLAEVWAKYTQKQTWDSLFLNNKLLVQEKLTQVASKTKSVYADYLKQKNTAKKIWNNNKEKLEKVLPTEEFIQEQRNKLLYRTILEAEKLPFKWTSKLGKITGKFAYRFNRQRRTIALKQIKFVFPNWSKEKIIQTAEDSFENIGETIFETLKKADYGAQIKKYVILKNLAVVQQIQKTGAILVTGHFANWEFATFALEMTGLQGIFLGKEEDFFAKKIVKRYRQTIGWESISVGETSLPLKIVRTLKAKKTIYTMLDTDPTSAKTLECNFFGKKANVASFPARIAKKYQIPVVAFFNHRTKDKKHIFSFHFLSQPPYTQNQSELELTQVYTTAIEQHIIKYPTQWRWAMARWKKEF